MTLSQAKREYYTEKGFTLSGPAYAMKLAEADGWEEWSKKPALSLSSKEFPSQRWHPSITRIILGLLP